MKSRWKLYEKSLEIILKDEQNTINESNLKHSHYLIFQRCLHYSQKVFISHCILTLSHLRFFYQKFISIEVRKICYCLSFLSKIKMPLFLGYQLHGISGKGFNQLSKCRFYNAQSILPITNESKFSNHYRVIISSDYSPFTYIQN